MKTCYFIIENQKLLRYNDDKLMNDDNDKESFSLLYWIGRCFETLTIRTIILS